MPISGYAAAEFFVSGTATSYAGEGALGEADYTTRIVALTPIDAAKFNGTVLVEWLNVSGGIDAPAVWIMAHREIVREGYAYVGVSAQQVGVQGGSTITGIDMSLKKQDPERYSILSHPGDAYSFDIFSQIGQLVRESAAEVLGRLQAGIRCGRGGVAVGDVPDDLHQRRRLRWRRCTTASWSIPDSVSRHRWTGCPHWRRWQAGAPDPAPFRPDLRVPVMNVITETDLVGAVLAGYYLARQPDNERLRTWEIPGTAHADNYTIKVGFIDTGSAPLDQLAAGYAPTNDADGSGAWGTSSTSRRSTTMSCRRRSPASAIWVRTGTPPPSAPRLEIGEGRSRRR